MNFLQRRRAQFLIKRAQPFADEALLAVANFTWVGNSMGAQSGVLGRGDWAGGMPEWTLIGAGGTRLFVIATERQRPDNGGVDIRQAGGATGAQLATSAMVGADGPGADVGVVCGA
jgi:hypothetical protein